MPEWRANRPAAGLLLAPLACMVAVAVAQPVAAGMPGINPMGSAPELIQIEASSASVPAAAHFGHLLEGEDQPGVLASLVFPMVSPLAPASVATGPAVQDEGVPVLEGKWLTQPLLIAGDDAASLQWLARHHAALRAMDAAVIVVAARDEAGFKRVQRAASGLTVAPVQGTWLTARLMAAGVRVRPVLIGLDGRALRSMPASGDQGEGESRQRQTGGRP